MSITLAQAEKMIAAAKEKSVALDTKMNIAVVAQLMERRLSFVFKSYVQDKSYFLDFITSLLL